MQTTQPTPQLLTLNQIVGNPKKGIIAIIPVSRSTFESRVKQGKYPKPVKLTERLNAWHLDDINRLIESMAQHDGAAV